MIDQIQKRILEEVADCTQFQRGLTTSAPTARRQDAIQRQILTLFPRQM